MDRAGSGTEVRGAMTALVTPFRNGEIDWPRVDALVDRQIDGGTDWLVPCGTTGETPTLAPAEREQLAEAVIARSGGRCPVMVGTGTNSTAATVRQTRQAAAAGADAVVIVAPYYNRPTAEGLFRHFAAVAEAVDLPIVLYNVPKRTGVSIDNDVVVRLRDQFPHIVAIKHATGSVDGVTDLLSRCDIEVLSGDDALTWPLMALGAGGVISVVSNLTPSLVKSQVVAATGGDLVAAERCHRKVYAVAEGIGRYGPNPVPIKTAMAINGLLEEEFRLPLCPLDSEGRAGIERVLRGHELYEPLNI
ncbi:MAG: 4-hydroxy-tetrahydrodipicolinate synthase [Planctomycetes bacterium]|nr:4-hydroxy-tetrahydrodipicolinate synthase [Planctomycetota bacterium]